MSLKIPRLRIFAGPNGSGKSTIKEVISKELLGIYINPDEIEKYSPSENNTKNTKSISFKYFDSIKKSRLQILSLPFSFLLYSR